MSTEEAKEYVDLVIETLVDWQVITDRAYGQMSEEQREKLAELVAAKSEE